MKRQAQPLICPRNKFASRQYALGQGYKHNTTPTQVNIAGKMTDCRTRFLWARSGALQPLAVLCLGRTGAGDRCGLQHPGADAGGTAVPTGVRHSAAALLHSTADGGPHAVLGVERSEAC